MEVVSSGSEGPLKRSRVLKTIEIFQSFRPYEHLLFECSEVLNELCASIWLYNLPVYDNRPKKTILKFRAKLSTQQIPFVTLAAFKHHIENITRLSKFIFLLRKTQTWIEQSQTELDQLSSIFQWTGGILELAADISSHQNHVQLYEKTMEKLGSLTYRLPIADANNSTSFQVRSLVNVDQDDMNCHLEANKRYTVVEHSNPYLWKLKETNQMVPSLFLEAYISNSERILSSRTQQKLVEFKNACISRIRNEMVKIIESMEDIPKRQAVSNLAKNVNMANFIDVSIISRKTLFFSKRCTSFKEHLNRPPPEADVVSFPPSLKPELLHWLQEDNKLIQSWKPVDQLRNWLHAQKGKISARLEDINQGMMFIRMMSYCDSEASVKTSRSRNGLNDSSRMMSYGDSEAFSEDYEESGFTEIEEPIMSNHMEPVNRSFSWSAKMETVTDVNKRYEWTGNIDKNIRTQMISRDPHHLQASDSTVAAKKIVWELTNRTASSQPHHPIVSEGKNGY